MRSRIVRAASALGLVVIGLVATGCQTGYSAYINNNTSQPLIVKMIDTRAGRLLASDRVGPNSKTALEAGQIPENNDVILEVDNQGNPGYPPSMRLSPGRTVVDVIEENPQTARSRLLLQIVPR